MTTNRVYHTVRISLLSAFLALVMCSFIAFGSGSAHAMTRSASSSTTTTTSRIVTNALGRAVFSPSTITVKSGTVVRIVNRTAYTRFVFTSVGFISIAPASSMTFTVTQSQYARICGGGALTITVV